MPVFCAVLYLLVLFVAPGLALLRWLWPREGRAPLALVEAAVVVPCLSVLVTSLVGIALAECGLFRFHLLVLIVALIAILGLVPRRAGLAPLEKWHAWRVELAFLVTVAAVAGILYFRPHEYVFGGWDPSAYLSTGASIERTGGILYHDEAFAVLPREAQDALSHHRQYLDHRFPALLVADHDTGLISPQFHHLYPTWLAVFRAAGGDRFMLYATPLFGVLSVLMLFILCRRFLPGGAAFAATVLFALNLTQIWQARFSTAEILTQLCLLTMLYLLMFYWESGSIAAALLAMLAMGMALHARFDSILVVILVSGLVYAHNLRRGHARDWLLVAGGLVAIAHIVMHSLLISFLYRPAYDLVAARPGFFAAIGAGVLAILVVVFAAFRRRSEALSEFATSPWVRLFAIALILGLAFYAYLVRPYLGGSARAGDPQNFVALGWFLTPVGLALAVVGACLLVARARTFAELTLIVFAVVLTAVYTKFGLIEKFYMWAARRFVPAVIPLLCILAGYAIAAVTTRLDRWRPAACGVIAAAIAAVPLVRGLDIVRARDYHGALSFVGEMDGALDADAVYLFNHYALAMPLKMLHGLDTYAVSDPEPNKCRVALDFAEERLGEGREVYFVDLDRPHIFPNLVCEPVRSFAFRSSRLVQSKGFPRGIEEARFDATVYRLVPIHKAPDDTLEVDLTWEFEPDWFHVGEGFSRGAKHNQPIKIVETEDGRRLDPTPETDPSEIRLEHAWLTGRRSALWIPYSPARRYVAEIRLSGRKAAYGVAISVAGQRLETIERGDAFRTVVVEIPPGIRTGTPRRALLEIVSLAPPEAPHARGVYLDRLRLRSVEEEGTGE